MQKTQQLQQLSHHRRHRKLEELNLLDNFLFQEMLTDAEIGEEFARILLSTILERPIRKVRIIPQKAISGIDTDRHGIRLDAYIEDVSEEENILSDKAADAQISSALYDIEPNIKYERQSLPKRMRYYHGLIDTKILSSGVDYDKLRNVVIIMILPYDPFDKNRMVYTIRNQCVEDTSVSYDDGAAKIFLYTKGTEGRPSQALKDMLQYIESTTIDNVTNQDIETINNFVNKVKQSTEVGISYMKSWEIEKMIADEAREEGLSQGRQEGLSQGRQEGLLQGIQAYIKMCKEFSLSREETVQKTVQEFPISHEKVEEYVSNNW